eukprot:1148931-Pelagomonas_calceolata.AAC.4
MRKRGAPENREAYAGENITHNLRIGKVPPVGELGSGCRSSNKKGSAVNTLFQGFQGLQGVGLQPETLADCLLVNFLNQ